MHASAASVSMANPFARVRSNRGLLEVFLVGLLRGASYSIIFVVVGILAYIVWRGAPVVIKHPSFLTKLTETLHVIEDKDGKKFETSPDDAERVKRDLGDNLRKEETISYSGGGILNPIVGTVLLVTVCMVVALTLGIACAIYMSEYARKGWFVETIRLAILNLAGVPSIVFGLFGLGAFVLAAPRFVDVPNARSLLTIPLGFTHISFEGWGVGVLAGGFTLATVILPVVITASEECLRAVPQGFRETSLALGATKWQTIRRCVLPFAMPGILTSSILGIARAAGETAPIMFTAAMAYRTKFPWQGAGLWTQVEHPKGLTDHLYNWTSQAAGSLTESVQALPYHIYTLAAKIPQNEYSERAQYGSVFVFLVLVLSLAAISILLRRKLRAKYKW